jgi:DNA-binding NarL/FixJ family response regulator
MKRLVVIADNPLIVAAIRSGIRDNGMFQLLGYVDPRKATAASIIEAGAEVVLVDEADSSDGKTITLIRDVKEHDKDVQVIVLALQMKGEWLARAFEAGANGAMSKGIHPVALSALLRAAVSGHIVHSPASIRSINPEPGHVATEHSSLTERELEILHLVASGATNGDIARQLWITQQTVKFHVSNVYRKLGVGNRTEACHYAHVNGLAAARQGRVPGAAGAEVLPIAS